MTLRRYAWSGLIMLTVTLTVAGNPPFSLFKKHESAGITAVALESIHPDARDIVRPVLEKPTLSARSQTEKFTGNLDVYRYFLDHPDRAVTAWRRLGAKCVSIEPKGQQRFRWADVNGSDVTWRTVASDNNLRVWLAEGSVKPNTVLPLVPVKAVVVLRYGEVADIEGAANLQHRTEMYIHTDNKTAALVTKMMGPSAQRLAEQGLGQFQFFFSGLSFYLGRHPDQIQVLMREEN